ncbi:hypothetical protein L9F63_019879, partial [Diploptera punctata]
FVKNLNHIKYYKIHMKQTLENMQGTTSESLARLSSIDGKLKQSENMQEATSEIHNQILGRLSSIDGKLKQSENKVDILRTVSFNYLQFLLSYISLIFAFAFSFY